MDFDPSDAITYIYKTAPEYGKAKGRVAELDAYRHSLKAIMMSRSTENTIGGQEKAAYASEEYQNLCKAIGEATEQAESLKWRLESARMRFELYRTLEASNRNIERLTR